MSRAVVADSTTLSETLRLLLGLVPMRETFFCSSFSSSQAQLIWFTILASAFSFAEGTRLKMECCFSFSTSCRFWCFLLRSSFSSTSSSPLGTSCLKPSCLSPRARAIGFREMYCMRPGCGRSKRMVWMLEARGQVTAGTRRPGPVVARIHDGSASTESGVLERPRTCIAD